jgi:hypothetical protein
MSMMKNGNDQVESFAKPDPDGTLDNLPELLVGKSKDELKTLGRKTTFKLVSQQTFIRLSSLSRRDQHSSKDSPSIDVYAAFENRDN